MRTTIRRVALRLLGLGGILAATVLAAPYGGSQERRIPPAPEGVELRQDVTYGAGGGRPLRMHWVQPKAAAEKPRPVVIWIHGGAWRSGSRDSGLGILYRMAQRGFAGASIEYRLSGEALFPAQIEDCKCAVRYLRAHARALNIDPDRIGAWGSSAGGHLVAMLAVTGDVKELEGTGGWADRSSRIQAAVDWFGPADLLRMVDEPSRIDRRGPDCPEALLIGGPLRENEAKARAASPVTYATRDDAPTLIMHGDQDPIVPPAQSRHLHEALRKAGVETELVMVPGAGHALPGPEHLERAASFLEKKLK